MKQYLQLMEDILESGEKRNDRTGVGTKALFGHRMEFDLTQGFPIVTTRKIFFNGLCDELLWMLSGSCNINDLPNRTRQIWDKDEWLKNEDTGHLGPSYGQQFRHRGYLLGSRTRTVNQIEYVIENIRQNPYSRRHVLSLWNQPDVIATPLPPCHSTALQFYVRDDEYLDCFMHARSQDACLGMAWNISQYSLLTHMIAHVTDYKPGRYIHSCGDVHIYQNHVSKARKQVKRNPFSKPELILKKNTNDIDDFETSDFELRNYQYHKKIKYPIAI